MDSLLYAIVGFLYLVLFLYALVKILGSPMAPLSKVIWIIICFCFPFVGSIIYLLIGEKR